MAGDEIEKSFDSLKNIGLKVRFGEIPIFFIEVSVGSRGDLDLYLLLLEAALDFQKKPLERAEYERRP